MPRCARLVFPGVPHHITQRGTDRQTTFFTNADRRVYLELLALHSAEAGVRLLAYCLMSNHIHLLAIPERENSLAIAMRRLHGRYAQYLNARRQRSGHLWQNRFFSCPLGNDRLWTAVRYVEQNPVRAGITERPEECRWCSAAEHLRGCGNLVTDAAFFGEHGGAGHWRQLLATKPDSTQIGHLRDCTYAGKTCGELASLSSRLVEEANW
jgi:putative transposase